jgi:cobalamin biosynthesis protein CobW
LHELFEDQLGSADLVLLSKSDLMTEEQQCAVESLVRKEIPPAVKIVRAQQGQVDLNVLLRLQAAAEEHIHLRSDHHGDDEHDHDEFDSIVVELPAVDKPKLLSSLQTLVAQQAIYRVKGFASLADRPMRMVVQGVGQRFETYFDRHWANGEKRGTTIVLIGEGLDSSAIQAALAGAAVTS